MTERNDRLLATVRKNAREEIRVTRGDFKGHDIVGLRVWFEDRAAAKCGPARTASPFAPSWSTRSSKRFGQRRMGRHERARQEGRAPRGGRNRRFISIATSPGPSSSSGRVG